jgi:hypothetical protein
MSQVIWYRMLRKGKWLGNLMVDMFKKPRLSISRRRGTSEKSDG